MKPIAHIRTDLPQKFGIPRNSFLAPHLRGRIVFEPEFALDAAVSGLEGFSHLWLIWQFENGLPGGTATDIATDTQNNHRLQRNVLQEEVAGVSVSAGESLERPNEGTGRAASSNTSSTSANTTCRAAAQAAPAVTWSPTVRPPRLGGAGRMGVFATRSPFRPNPLGLTCVKLSRIEHTNAGPVIHVLGADLRDNTPIYDIKPYIPFADCHPEATGGFIEQVPWQELQVDFPTALALKIPAEKRAGLIEILQQDPRRAGSKHEPERVYHLAYAEHDVSFTVDAPQLFVVDVEKLDGQQ